MEQVKPFITSQTIYNKSNHLQQVKPFTTSQTIYNKSNHLQQYWVPTNLKKSLKRPMEDRSFKSKDRKNNGQRKKEKKTNNNLQNTTHKTNNWITKTPLNTWGDPMCSRRVTSSCSTSVTHCVTFVTNLVISHEWVLGFWKYNFVYKSKQNQLHDHIFFLMSYN